MENRVQLTPLEALGVAIKAEIEAAEMYERLANLVKNRALKEKAHFLQGEELKHRALLEVPGACLGHSLKMPGRGIRQADRRRFAGLRHAILKVALETHEMPDRSVPGTDAVVAEEMMLRPAGQRADPHLERRCVFGFTRERIAHTDKTRRGRTGQKRSAIDDHCLPQSLPSPDFSLTL